MIGTACALVWGWRQLRRRSTSRFRWEAALTVGVLITVVWGTASLLPARLRAYRNGFCRSSSNIERTPADRGVHQALVLVPESWGARLVVNLWTLGVRRVLTERAYRQVDACEFHRFAAQIRRKGTKRVSKCFSLGSWIPLSVRSSEYRDGQTPQLRTPVSLTTECEREMQRDLRGFALYGSLAWRNAVDLDRGIVFAREPAEQVESLLSHYPIGRYGATLHHPDNLTPFRFLTLLRAAGDLDDGA